MTRNEASLPNLPDDHVNNKRRMNVDTQATPQETVALCSSIWQRWEVMRNPGVLRVSSVPTWRVSARAFVALAATLQVGCGEASPVAPGPDGSHLCGPIACDAQAPLPAPGDTVEGFDAEVGGTEGGSGGTAIEPGDAGRPVSHDASTNQCDSGAGCQTSTTWQPTTSSGPGTEPGETDDTSPHSSATEDTATHDRTTPDSTTPDSTATEPNATSSQGADPSASGTDTDHETPDDTNWTDGTATDATSTDTTSTDATSTDTTSTDATSTDATSTGGASSADGSDTATLSGTTGGDSWATDEGTNDATESTAELDSGAPPIEPLPVIESGPATLAADGVALLTTADITPDGLVGLELGGHVLDPTDPEQVQWLQTTVASSERPSVRVTQLAVRAPSTLQAGATSLRVVTRTGSASWPLAIIEPSGAYPSSPLGILGTSAAASGVFPISTVAPGVLIVDTSTGAAADFSVQYRVWMRSAGRDDCPVARAGKGTLYGHESITPAPDDSGPGELTSVPPEPFQHPIAGEYELHSQANFIRLTIDRTSSGGIVESYAGGWTSYPGNTNLMEPALPDPSERAHPPPLDPESAMVVLTSERTGRQLMMSRRIEDIEETSSVRACLPEIP